MRNRIIKTFEEYTQKIEIEDSTVHFHFDNDMDDERQFINREPKAGDEVMVDLPLVKLNHVDDPDEEPEMDQQEIDQEEDGEIEPLEPAFDIQSLEDEEDSDYQESDKSDEEDDDEEDEEDE